MISRLAQRFLMTGGCKSSSSSKEMYNKKPFTSSTPTSITQTTLTFPLRQRFMEFACLLTQTKSSCCWGLLVLQLMSLSFPTRGLTKLAFPSSSRERVVLGLGNCLLLSAAWWQGYSTSFSCTICYK